MKKSIQSILKMTALAFVASAFVFGCSDDDDNKDNSPGFTGESHTYTLAAEGDSNISGTAQFRERTDGSMVVTLNMEGTTAGQSYPVYIRSNAANQTGTTIVQLEPVNGETGMSTTIIDERDNGTSFTYDDLMGLNGTLVVTMSNETVVSQADIGSNELTTTSRTYNLSSVGESAVSGTVTFAKRMNGTTLVTTNLDGTETGTAYPIAIYSSSLTTPGASAIALTNVNGSTGTTATSTTSVSALDAGGAVTYDQLNTFDGHIGVGTMGSPTTYIASSNIGMNADL